jgi:hypothetical protein
MSTPFMFNKCKELKEIAESHDHIERIVILYFGDSDEDGNNIRKNIEKALIFYSGGGTYISDDGQEIEIPASEDLEIPVEIELRHIAITPEQVKGYKLTGYQLEAFMTTENRLKILKQILQDAIDDCHDEYIYDESCPPEEFNYEEAGIEEPKDIDPDNEFYEDTGMTIREKMISMATEAFKPDWEEWQD